MTIEFLNAPPTGPKKTGFVKIIINSEYIGCIDEGRLYLNICNMSYEDWQLIGDKMKELQGENHE